MSQPAPVMALRKRMRVFGYRDISFILLQDGSYLVSAVEPLAGSPVYRRMFLCDMNYCFRRLPTSR